MEKWFVMTKKADFEGWAARLGVSPVLARILRNRGITEVEEAEVFLKGELKDCPSPHLMKDMDLAARYLLEAVGEKRKIRVIGDYDVDGICSAYILTRGLELLGGQVDTAIPHRIHDGYGLNENLIREAAEDGVEMILTCDNGIAAGEQIELARSLGISVIVTDHHEVPFRTEGERRIELLPEALAVVDPRREGETYPFPGICGAVVAYKLMAALPVEDIPKERRAAFRDGMEELLEFAAFATVCDVMELKGENRILVKEGLKRMRKSRNPGLRALMEVNGIDPDKLSAHHLGFVMGPCINATGRLDTAKRSLELLLSRDPVEAMQHARELKDLNDSRKSMTLQGVEQAGQVIRAEHMEEDKVLVIFLPQVHESLAGIIAGRIREQYYRPVYILTKGEEGVKGSGRSIEGYHMYEEMNRVGHLFTKYGGHRMAAGFSLEEENVGPLRKALNENCPLTADDLIPKVHIDVPMPMAAATEELAREIELLEPFGVGNPKPLFAQRSLVFLSCQPMGAEGRYGRFRVRLPEGGIRQLVYFGELKVFLDFVEENFGPGMSRELLQGRGEFPVNVVYQLGLNTYQGKTSLQFFMQNFGMVNK